MMVMPGYDSWKTRSPDDDLGDEYEQPTPEQERADWEDQMQQAGICPTTP
jgi:hypothetical protein